MEEKELLEKLELAKKERAENCIEEIKAILEKYNCKITTSDEVVINGQAIVPVIKPL